MVKEGGGRPLDRGLLRRICNTNAFGPDFKHYDSMEKEWRMRGKRGREWRLVGLYLLPAMINHSCLPNACRVFVGETMIVRASRDLKKGEEVVWPYTPPLQPYYHRQEQLENHYGFRCRCRRCGVESKMPLYKDVCLQAMERRSGSSSGSGSSGGDATSFITEIESHIELAPDAEGKRWCRASFLHSYFDYFNRCAGSSRAEERQQVSMA